MKNLLIALLLVIFSFQGATVAIGGDGAGVAYAQQAAAVIDDVADADADTDELNVSAAIEELSDYLPADLAFAQGLYPAPTRPEPTVLFLSVLLPAAEPPPRA